ncbi:MAG: hypothetical protein QOD31_576 [Pseudonocardiales bacterium]|nr:hypothetical protein [Pseudonocardiales bacterium]
MFSSVGPGDEAAALALYEAGVTALITVAQANPTGASILQLLRGLETGRNRLATAEHALIADAEAQGLPHEHACPSTPNWLSQLLRINPAEATARVKAAADLGPRRGLTGEQLPPIFEQVAAAQASGEISAAHARVITRCVDALPAAVQAEHDLAVQASLVEHAHTLNPRQLGVCARRIADCLDPDGTLTNERDRHRRREFTIHPRPDGSARIEGELTALCAEALRTVLDTLARPAPAAAGQRDPRTAGQRNHDGLHDGLLMLLRSEQLPDCGGIAATIVLTMTPEQLENGTGLVTTGHGALISAQLALSLLGDARITPVALGTNGEIITYGNSHRFFTEGQRLAMIARDQGCSFPGCDQPPARTQAHHITDYAITGRTTVADGTLLCGFHHREFEVLDWVCHMINGIPHWTAPRWLDPTQTPRRNRAHAPALV